jgi:Zn-dependent protease with chaperone function
MVGQLDASIVAGLLLLVAILARHRLSPLVRSFLLLIALVRLVLPPWIRSPWSEAVVDVPPIDEARILIAWGLQWDVAMYAAAITTGVSVFLLARVVWTFATAERRWLASTEPLSIPLVERINDFACTSIVARPTFWGRSYGTARFHCRTYTPLGTTMAIEARLSRRGEGPLAVGLRRKLIILPESVLRLDDAAIGAVLAHEIAHHERRDLAWIALASALKAVAWFNPLAHVIARALVAAREDGTDDWAVSRTSNDPFAYAQALLQSARMVATPQPLGAAGAHPMGRRLQRLLDGHAAREGRLGVAGFGIILLAATAALPGAHLPSASDGEQRIIVVIERA